MPARLLRAAADVWRGAAGPFPPEAPPAARVGLALWRASILLVPLLGLLSVGAFGEPPAEAPPLAEGIMTALFVVFVLAVAFALVATQSLALLPLLAFVLLVGLVRQSVVLAGPLLAWGLGRTLRGGFRSPRAPLRLLGVAAFAGLLMAPALSRWGPAPALAALAPLVARILLGRSRSRSALSRARACPLCKGKPEVVAPSTAGAPCRWCGVRVLG